MAARGRERARFQALVGPTSGVRIDQSAAQTALMKYGIAERGESIVYMAGHIARMPFSTMMKLHRVGEET